MSIFNFKNINNVNISDINIICKDISNIDIYISENCYINLSKTKKLINKNLKKWENIKKVTNIHEYIHTSPYKNIYVSKIKPISRSFYKMIEILKDIDILKIFKFINITSFHLAEGPGGFIEALSYIRDNNKDKYIGMTLINNKNKNIPKLNKNNIFLKTNNNFYIEKGIDKTGNLYNSINFKYCYDKYKNKIDLITADGGFDFSSNYKNQEILATRLILTEIFYALIMQKKGGVFILKVFDTFTKTSCDIMYLLTCFYSNIFIFKPKTSRSANSEKYIICKNYINNIDLFNIFYNIIQDFENINFNKKYINSILNFNHNIYFLNKINKINNMLGEKQIININSTINIIKNNKNIKNIKKYNIKKSMQWCKNYNIPYNYIKTID